MTDNPDAHPKVGKILRLADTPHAPFIYYENAPIFGFTNGIVNVTLSAFHTWAGPDGIVNEQVAVAHLRGNVSSGRKSSQCNRASFAAGRACWWQSELGIERASSLGRLTPLDGQAPSPDRRVELQ
jgi:hypothetical protein